MILDQCQDNVGAVVSEFSYIMLQPFTPVTFPIPRRVGKEYGANALIVNLPEVCRIHIH